MKQLFLLLTLTGLTMSGCMHNQNEPAPITTPGQHPAVMTRDVTLKLDYLIYLPTDYSEQQKWPLIVFLHGAGERGNDLNQVRTQGLPKLIESGETYPFIIASPQCRPNLWWPDMIEQLMALTDEVCEKYHVDEDRIYLTGLSMGGAGTWSAGCAHPERFAAIAPICGGGMPLMARNLKDVPVWAFHGAKDTVVPLHRSQEMVDAVNAAGGRAKLTVYPEAGHDSWTQTYANPQLYSWLLSHKKNKDKQ